MKDSYKSKESAYKAHETAKKKVTRKANPQAAYPRPSESKAESDETLAARSLKPPKSADEYLAHGYCSVAADPGQPDVDAHDNERNFERMNKGAFGPVYGPQKREQDDPEGEDYGESNVSESGHLDD